MQQSEQDQVLYTLKEFHCFKPSNLLIFASFKIKAPLKRLEVTRNESCLSPASIDELSHKGEMRQEAVLWRRLDFYLSLFNSWITPQKCIFIPPHSQYLTYYLENGNA